MGKEGVKLNTFVSQLSRDMAACKLESFRWTDYSILIMINMLRSSDKIEEKLAERLNQLYDAAETENRVLNIATVQQYLPYFSTVHWNKNCRIVVFQGSVNKSFSPVNIQGSSAADEGH